MRLWIAFRQESLVFLWVGWGEFTVILAGCRPLPAQRLWFVKQLQIAFQNSRFWKARIGFGKKPSVLSNIYLAFSRRKSSDFGLLGSDCGHRKNLWPGNIRSRFQIKPRLTSGCSPSPQPSPHTSAQVACRLNHALCSLQRGLWKLNHCFGTV